MWLNRRSLLERRGRGQRRIVGAAVSRILRLLLVARCSSRLREGSRHRCRRWSCAAGWVMTTAWHHCRRANRWSRGRGPRLRLIAGARSADTTSRWQA